MNEQADDLRALMRLLNAAAGIAGGVATPLAARALASGLGSPEQRIAGYAANMSGLAWAGASLLDVLVMLQERGLAARNAGALPAEAQLELWRRLREGA